MKQISLSQISDGNFLLNDCHSIYTATARRC